MDDAVVLADNDALAGWRPVCERAFMDPSQLLASIITIQRDGLRFDRDENLMPDRLGQRYRCGSTSESVLSCFNAALWRGTSVCDLFSDSRA
jgi:hypothetical protein